MVKASLPIHFQVSESSDEMKLFVVLNMIGFPYEEKRLIKGLRKKLISSEAAFNEAARKQYKSRESQYGDDDDYD